MPILFGVAACAAVSMCVVLVGTLGDPRVFPLGAPGIILGVMAIGASLLTPYLVFKGTSGLGLRVGPRWPGLLVGYAVVVFAPVAVGRALARAAVVTTNGTDVGAYFAGLAAGLVAWAVIQCIPPLRVRRLGIAVVSCAVAFGVLLDLAKGLYFTA